MDWLRSVAPTLATALLGPLGGVAVQAIGSALGMSDATKEKVEKALSQGQMTGEQLAALKQADLDFAKRMKELDIDLERVHAGDRANARDMQKATGSRVPATLAILVTLGFFGVLGYMLIAGKPPSGGDALLVMLGSLGTAWTAIVTYYFGSSAGSASKDALLAKR